MLPDEIIVTLSKKIHYTAYVLCADAVSHVFVKWWTKWNGMKFNTLVITYFIPHVAGDVIVQRFESYLTVEARDERFLSFQPL